MRGGALIGAHITPPPVFIVGSGRSGTTLLRRVLTATDAMFIPGEFSKLGWLVRYYARQRCLGWDNVCVKVSRQFNQTAQIDGYKIDVAEWLKRISALEPERQSFAAMIDEAYCMCAETAGAKANRWGDKTPANSMELVWIDRAFPNALYIHMLRDGVDVSRSFRREQLEADMDPCDVWIERTQAVVNFERANPGRVHTCRYEELVGQPERATRAVCEFIGLEFDEKMLSATDNAGQLGNVLKREHHKHLLEPISTSHIGKGRRELTEPERSELAKRLNKPLKRFGYDPL